MQARTVDSTMVQFACFAATTASPRENRRSWLRLAVFLLTLAFSTPALAAHSHDCPQEIGNKTVRNLQGLEIEFTATKNDDYAFGHACKVVVRDTAQNVVFSEEDFDFPLVLAETDLNGDGVPDSVLESYSGGAHCCWTYYIISQGEKPHLVAQFDNERGAGFARNETSGRVDIVTQDGAFDYFDGLCHACTVFPLVYVRLQGDHLVDVGADHTKDYDEIIAKSQQALSAQERQSFRSATEIPYKAGDATDTTPGKVLSIVFAYLYSGRQAQARQVLQEFWPPFDQERIWKLILDTQQKGILSQTRRDRH